MRIPAHQQIQFIPDGNTKATPTKSAAYARLTGALGLLLYVLIAFLSAGAAAFVPAGLATSAGASE